MSRLVGKKRKPVADLESERTLFSAFQQAAAGVSSLYTLASQQRRQSQQAGARQALERVASWVFTQYAGSAVVPTAALLEFLRQEMQDCLGGEGGGEYQATAFPPVALPVLGDAGYGEGGNSCDENMLEDQSGLLRRGGPAGGGSGGMQISPHKRAGSGQALHQQHQHASQQQLYMSVHQQQQQQQQQQAQQLEQQGHSVPGCFFQGGGQ